MSWWPDLLAVISSAAGNEGAVTAPSSNVASDLVTKTPAGQFLTFTEGIPGWGLLLMFLASVIGSALLFMQLRASGWE